tara:strand:+ start:3384 stop:4091 length:708 start_codon:yes stop_codon:yes gene_type:complete
MTENNNSDSTEQTSDIKPVRSEAMSNITNKRLGGASMLFTATLGFINLGGLILLFFWFFNTSGNQQLAGQSFVERISVIEESLSEQKLQTQELIESTDQDLKFINKEIRKLWDLSNKKNRKEIANNLKELKNLDEELSKLNKLVSSLGAKQRARDLEFSKLENSLDKLKTQTAGLVPAEDDSILEGRLAAQDEAIDSMDAYRKQVNKTLMSLQRQIDKLLLNLELNQSEQATSTN